jgi:hypothetical protein
VVKLVASFARESGRTSTGRFEMLEVRRLELVVNSFSARCTRKFEASELMDTRGSRASYLNIGYFEMQVKLMIRAIR